MLIFDGLLEGAKEKEEKEAKKRKRLADDLYDFLYSSKVEKNSLTSDMDSGSQHKRHRRDWKLSYRSSDPEKHKETELGDDGEVREIYGFNINSTAVRKPFG
ncbi:Hypothetical predicted protein [Olea europaea subsp. europaea]|uniref:Uncharacterized protein n=1 Tax=Olea europaea subsp. europaea TaxID=158383 RepID=A0A8S0SMV7_OLEEU|nr:Hypothetical predicted protein [Olea europaea subsp. europaea]